jgi:NADPH:quinone reductase-like Zn-dependent oxidoreductase
MEKNKEYSAEKSRINRRNALGIIGGIAAGSLLTTAVEKAHPERFPTGSLRKRFPGKVVLITGATSGIGRAAAVAFAAEGAKVAFCGRRENLGHQVEAQIKAQGGEATYIRADVRQESSVRAFVDEVVEPICTTRCRLQ